MDKEDTIFRILEIMRECLSVIAEEFGGMDNLEAAAEFIEDNIQEIDKLLKK